jgi:hypothetical protein
MFDESEMLNQKKKKNVASEPLASAVHVNQPVS